MFVTQGLIDVGNEYRYRAINTIYHKSHTLMNPGIMWTN